jgi:hypothetical protein
MKFNLNWKINSIVFFALIAFSPLSVKAAEIYFGVNAKEVAANSAYEVGVYVNTGGEAINAISGDINFPAEQTDLQNIYTGNSALLLWIKDPALTAPGVVSFAGIVPGGLTSGNGYLFTLVLKSKQTGTLTVNANNEQILLNDGNGSSATVTKAPLALSVVTKTDAPAYVPPFDRTPPEPFELKTAQDPTLFNNKWFVTFASQDKGVGVDHYEIREVPPAGSFAGLLGGGRWLSVANGPYELSDQSLESTIEIKAVDRAGNNRIVSLPPANGLSWYKKYFVWLAIIALLACFVGYRKLLLKRKK